MKTKTLYDYKNTQTGPCLIIGNGPSLLDFPFHLIGTIPSFACNFFPVHAPGVPIDYLVMIDKMTMRSDKLWERIRPSTLAFCFAKWAGDFPRRENVVWWANKDEPIPGFSFGDVWGQYFPTSAHAACWMAGLMGFDDIYLIGMDGTSQAGELSGVDEYGKSGMPHFYDDKPGKDSILWDIAWGNMAHYLGEKNKSITNLSSKTAITQLLRRDHRDFFIESDSGGGEWPGGFKHPGRTAILHANLRNEPVASASPYDSRALDGVGHVVPDRGLADFEREYLGTFEPPDPELLPKHVRGERA